MGFVFGMVGCAIGILIAVITSRLLPKKTVYGTIRLIGVDEETGQYNAAIVWPEVDDIAKSKQVILLVVNNSKNAQK